MTLFELLENYVEREDNSRFFDQPVYESWAKYLG